jgi:hypothetical protein
MRIPDENLAEVFDRGFTVMEGFLDKATLRDAQDALWEIYPRPEDYFANPDAYPAFTTSQFAGLRFFPYPSWALNKVAVYPDLIDAAERFLRTSEIDCYKVELWAKYSGAIDYDQAHHRDYENHTIVVPRAEMGRFFEDEVPVTGPAGTILIYKTDVFHRGSNFKAPGRSRFVMPVDFKPRGWRWQGKLAWPDRAEYPGWKEAMVNMTPRQRDLFGWPPAGDPYWNAQTLSDVALRYPGIDLTPYGAKALA